MTRKIRYFTWYLSTNINANAKWSYILFCYPDQLYLTALTKIKIYRWSGHEIISVDFSMISLGACKFAKTF